eukprot:CAMPEP_0206138634 /NCGR_PEP_ID=MMETSP1473-20131121/3453_1 /ASSEMBLY_ACC=CAM_ASM_001109 /TAXON_ID=1461547 /ORGANISM="Stichococcus sp, Strain RCC1054" /LENGTH=353 /DNA_ID=CAMNT_0053532113 /DNA_START=304 /DNA_END=1365 /DNA_ORIENTATION=-
MGDEKVTGGPARSHLPGKRTTAMEIVRGFNLEGKTAVVTGGNSGIGAETVQALAWAGAKVIMTSRDEAAGLAVANRIASSTGTLKGSIVVKQLDLADLNSVRQLSRQLQKEASIDFLILNAGVMFVPRSFTKDGFEMHWGTNHVGHFALTTALLPKLRSQSTPSRVIVLSSVAHKWQKKALDFGDLDFSKRKYNKRAAYGQSKCANILFVKQLAVEVKGSQVEAFAVHPGVVSTPLWRNTGGCISGLVHLFSNSVCFGVKNPEQGAATTVYAAVAPELAGKSGIYLADCKEATPTKVASNTDLAARLWTITEAQLAKAELVRTSLSKGDGLPDQSESEAVASAAPKAGISSYM